MLNQMQAQVAADALFDHWRSGSRMPALPEGTNPSSRAEGYQIQAGWQRRSRAAIVGWKIAATSTAGQSHIGVDGPLAGRLLAEGVMTEGGQASLAGNAMRVAEVEFAFRMGRTLAPRREPYSVDEVMAAVESLHPAIEIPDSRFTDFAKVGAAALLADNACAHQFVLGPAAGASWRAIDLAQHKTIGRIRGGLVREGTGANVLGDPRIALAWIANELSRHDLTLAQGHVVTTGTSLVPIDIKPGDLVEADLGVLGGLSVQFI